MTVHDTPAADVAHPALMPAIEAVAAEALKPRVREIDAGLYPREVMKAFGAAGAYATHLPDATGEADLRTAIQVMARAGEECISTAFCMWCQSALAWYLHCSDNDALKAALGPAVASGDVLGGTGLSNPMKTFFGIETMKLKARRAEDGWIVRGALPWVSNLEERGWFGIVFEEEGADPAHRVMAVAQAGAEGVRIVEDHDFLSMGGTATVGVQFRDAFIPDAQILADPIEPYLARIRGGFVLLQCGMALGMVRSSIALMEQVRKPLGHVNGYLDKQPEDFAETLAALETEIDALAQTPFDHGIGYFRRVLEARLAGGEAAMEAAHYAMLHCGARGFVGPGEAQRRMRESYFIGIVTPATKQLKKMLAELPAA